MPPIDREDFEQFARDSREFQGKVLQWMEGKGEHITAISLGVKDVRNDLSEHKENKEAHAAPIGAAIAAHDKEPAAHGARAAAQNLSQIISVVGALGGLVALGVTVWRSGGN